MKRVLELFFSCTPGTRAAVRVAVVPLGVLMFLCGCDSVPDGRLPTAPVEVTVIYNGEPVEDAVITFANEVGPPPAFGKTDAQGRAQMTTYEASDGATLGEHQVTVIKQVFDKTREEAPQDSPDYNPSPGASPLPVVKDLLPRRYALPANSGLTASVVDGENKVTLQLTD